MAGQAPMMPLPRRAYGTHWPQGFYGSEPVYRGMAAIPAGCRVEFGHANERALRQLHDALKRWKPGNAA